jgi:dephospho-CoA kinase
LVIGLTGGFGSGKSTVSEEFKRLGATIADADAVSRKMVEPGGPAYGKVVRLFGRNVVKPDGTLDRHAIAAKVFSKTALRKKLEGILHPLVRRSMEDALAKTKSRIVVLDIPLLFESKMTDLADRICVVWAPRSVRYERLMKTGRFPCRDIRDRMKAQMLLTDKRRLADDVVDNGGSLAHTNAQVRRLMAAWKRSLSV